MVPRHLRIDYHNFEQFKIWILLTLLQRALGAPSLHLMQMHVANDYSSPFTGTSSLKPSNKKQARR